MDRPAVVAMTRVGEHSDYDMAWTELACELHCTHAVERRRATHEATQKRWRNDIFHELNGYKRKLNIELNSDAALGCVRTNN